MTDLVDELAKVIDPWIRGAYRWSTQAAKAVLDSGLVVPTAERDKAQFALERLDDLAEELDQRASVGQIASDYPWIARRIRRAIEGGGDDD